MIWLRISFGSLLLASLGLAEESSAPVKSLGLSEEWAEDSDLFRSLGVYQVQSGLLIAPENRSEVTVSFDAFELFSNGVELRLKANHSEKNYYSFEIYQSRGVYDATGETLMPGLQAISRQGGVLRQLNVSHEQLTLTRFFECSVEIEVIYARRSQS